MPGNLSHSTLNRIRILENHDSLSRYSFREMLWLLAAKILFKEINFVVLADAFLSTSDQILGGLAKTEIWVSVKLLGILSYITVFSVVVVLGPTYSKLFLKYGSCMM